MKLSNVLFSKTTGMLALIALSFAAGSLVTTQFSKPSTVSAASNHVYELRVYHAMPGKYGDLVKEFREDIRPVFEKHGINSLGYWLPQDAPAKDNLFIYIVSHPSREAAAKAWQGFRDDEDWKKISARTGANGKLVDHVDSTFMDPTDFSLLK